MRVLLTRGSMNRSREATADLPPDSVVQDEDTILADSERVVATFHQRGEDAMVQIALAPCSPFSVTTSLMACTAALADKLDVRLHTHLGETEDENRYCEEIYGCRPLDYLEQTGWLNKRTWLAHGIHFNAGGNAAARQGRDYHQSLLLQQSAVGLRLLPGLRDGGRGRRHRPRRRWFGVE